jgi:tetratricopeptide (TPR) repeat protein
VLIVAILLLQLAAEPPPAAEAARLVHASIRDYELGFFEKALHEAEEAYRIDPLPQILFNIGQCQKALKHWEQAAINYQHYLAKVPDAPNRAKVEDLLTEVTYRLKAEQLPSPAPPPAPAAPTPVVVVAAAPTPVPTPAPTEPVPAAAVEAAPPSSHSHAAGWVLASVAVACLGVAVAGIVGVENYESYRNRLANPTSYTQYQKDFANAASEGDQANTWEAVAITTGAAALVAGTTAAFVW